MKKLLALTLFLILATVNASFAQDGMSKSEMTADAELYFKGENYLAALPLYKALDSLDPSIDLKFKLGICYLYKTDEIKRAMELLQTVLEDGSKQENLHFYLGRAFAMNYKFDPAIQFYNEALSKKTSKDKLEAIPRFIEYCENGKKLVASPIAVTIENIGKPVNSKYSEYVPVISADESIMIFTYRGAKSTGGRQNIYAEPDPKGRYFEDVFQSVKLGGETWSEPERIGENINTHGHDASLALSANGQKLFIYKDTEGSSGDLYVSELEGYTWSVPVALDSNINTSAWEGGVSLSADENTLYFASEQEGGIGGRDIYKSARNDNGSWGKAVNLGSRINTPYDDESPFIHPDGKTLFFSSQGHQSMGGYDIFRSLAVSDTGWTTPENIGYPLNTTGDDRYYVVSADGERGYYASKKIGGLGQHDIYVVHLGDAARKHALVLVKGVVTANDKAAEAEIKVEYANTRLPYEGYFKSNSATGKYIVILPGENDYNLTFNVKGFAPHVENINAIELTKYTEIVRDVRMYSKDYQRSINISGRLMIEGDLKPASLVTMFIKEVNETVELQTTTDGEGNFSFADVPSGFTYTFSIAEGASFEKALITGLVVAGDVPKPDIHFAVEGGSETFSAEDGTYELEILRREPTCAYPIKYLKPYTGGSTFPDLSDELYKKIMDKYGSCVADGLVFRVQIGAYFTPENFNYKYFNDLGNVSQKLLKDGITRFVMGNYTKMKDGELLRNKAVRIGDKDAFIVIYYNGERMMIEEAIKS
ncbi:MAG: PD40 domain-containing protein, partial [Flavobacteriales bacterium]|nr:PD40 domain-containing protein [Flavobacteriales bacterium]